MQAGEKNMNNQASNSTLKLLTYLMFLIFAMTTDAVGVIIPEIIKRYDLTLTQASTFHYGVMIAMALTGVSLGFLADRFGRKLAIILGLAIFAAACFLFPFGDDFAYFLCLLLATGVGIGIFKTAALALIGDISSSPKEHTHTMNLAEGYFGIGAIIGPAIVTYLIHGGLSWVYLYAFAGASALLLIVIASLTNYPPKPPVTNKAPSNWRSAIPIMKDRYALGFSSAIALYVVVEAGIYVWLPTLLADYDGSAKWMSIYALSIFFIFRAAGRFLGAWILDRVRWQTTLTLFTGMIFACYFFSTLFGIEVGVWLLPASGLFMSVIYPTLNSKGINCFPVSQHGAIAGVILFFTATAAALGPLMMGVIGDVMGHVSFGFGFAMISAGLLFAMAIWNQLRDPSKGRIDELAAVNAPT